MQPLCVEERSGVSSIVEDLFGCAVESVSVCRCGWSNSRRHTEFLFSLTYPPSKVGVVYGLSSITLSAVDGEHESFGAFLEASMCRQQRVHAWCDSCGKFKPTVMPAFSANIGIRYCMSSFLRPLSDLYVNFHWSYPSIVR